MSRNDLDAIQAKLKIAIQSHQVVVTKLKSEPQNQNLRQQLHNLQKEIFVLSEQQKGIVHSLKKEIVHRQPATVAQLVQQSKQISVSQMSVAQPIILPMAATIAQPLVQVLPKPLGVTQNVGVAPQMTLAQSQPIGVGQQPVGLMPQMTLPQPMAVSPQMTAQSMDITQPIGMTPQMTLAQPMGATQPISMTQQSVASPSMVVSQPINMGPQQLCVAQQGFQLTPSMQPMIHQMLHPLHQVRPLHNPAFYKQPIQPKPLVENVPPSPAVSIPSPSKVKTPVSANQDSAEVTGKGGNLANPTRSSPPIRVPQYTLHRPSILQNSNRSISKAPANLVSSYTRKPSDSDHRQKTNENSPPYNEEKQKLAFMTALDLVTKETLKELQSRKYERKRRTTANPLYNFEPERRRPQSLLLTANGPAGKRGRGRPPKGSKSPTNSHASTPDSHDGTSNGHAKNGSMDVHDDFCNVCGQSGQLLLCDTCSKVYHLQCLDPPLQEIPEGKWGCPKCQASGKFSWSSETIAMVNNFIAKKSAKEEERRKLQRKNHDLLNEKILLDNKQKQFNEDISGQIQRKDELLEKNKLYQQKVENLKNFIKLIQSS